jgi:2-polyprenyl-6-methoxyphenol hydroxylase-like FAD-dependent oxidoreductase
MPISVTVIGAGPVGLMTALRLAQAGIKVTCLEAEASLIRSPRAMVFHPVVTEELERSGIIADILKRRLRSESVCLKMSKTGKVIAKLVMDTGGVTGRESLVIRQGDLSDIILEHLAKYDHCKILYDHRVIAMEQPMAEDSSIGHIQPQVTTLSEKNGAREHFSADCVVAADGGRSTIRHLLDIPFDLSTYEDDQLVVASLQIPQAPVAWSDADFRVNPGSDWGLVAQIRDDLWRMAYKEQLGLSEGQIRDRLPDKLLRLSGEQAIKDVRIEMIASYRLQQHCAATFLKGRVVLAGDAAHLCDPFGTFELTSGLLDATALADALVAIYRHEASTDTLECYAVERRKIFIDLVNPLSQDNEEGPHGANFCRGV